MAFLIRPATPQDLAAILAIYNHEVLNGFATWNDQLYTLDSFPTKLLDFQKQNFPFVVIDDQDQTANRRLC